jgi:hypothetical protein
MRNTPHALHPHPIVHRGWTPKNSQIYGSLEFLTREQQRKIHNSIVSESASRSHVRSWMMVSFSGLVALFFLFILVGAPLIYWLTLPELQELASENSINEDAVVYSQVQPPVRQEFLEVKGKLHKFFTSALSGQAADPLVITEREINAILIHDHRLGLLCNKVFVRIINGRIQTSFDLNLGNLGPFWKGDANVKGIGDFRLALKGRELRVVVDALKVNHKNLHHMMHRLHNVNLSAYAKDAVRHSLGKCLTLLGLEVGQPRLIARPVLTTFNISPDSTRNIFSSMNHPGKGVLNWATSPPQLFLANRIFSFHSRIHDLLLSLDKIQITNGSIILYPAG